MKAAEAVIEKAKIIAGHQLEVSPDDLEFVDGALPGQGRPGHVDDDPGRRLGGVHRARPAGRPRSQPVRRRRPSTRRCSPTRTAPTCARSRWTPRPAWTSIRSYVAVDDVGVQINPMIVEGQLHGGITQGIAQALWEGAEYDEDGNLLTASLADYLVPGAPGRAARTSLDRTITPSTTHPLGTKGVGEAGAIASTPAVINAILDALRPLGVARRRHAGLAADGLAGDTGCEYEGFGRNRRCRSPAPSAPDGGSARGAA